MNKCARLAVALLAAASLASAEDAKTETAKVAGKWEMTRETPRGKFTSVFNFEQDGESLKGTVTMRDRDMPLTGTVKGDKVEFSFSGPGRDGETRTMNYTGKVAGDEMKLEFETPGGKREATAKRAGAADAAPPAAETKPATP
jgi:hypothetical protein